LEKCSKLKLFSYLMHLNVPEGNFSAFFEFPSIGGQWQCHNISA